MVEVWVSFSFMLAFVGWFLSVIYSMNLYHFSLIFLHSLDLFLIDKEYKLGQQVRFLSLLLGSLTGTGCLVLFSLCPKAIISEGVSFVCQEANRFVCLPRRAAGSFVWLIVWPSLPKWWDLVPHGLEIWLLMYFLWFVQNCLFSVLVFSGFVLWFWLCLYLCICVCFIAYLSIFTF